MSDNPSSPNQNQVPQNGHANENGNGNGHSNGNGNGNGAARPSKDALRKWISMNAANPAATLSLSPSPGNTVGSPGQPSAAPTESSAGTCAPASSDGITLRTITNITPSGAGTSQLVYIPTIPIPTLTMENAESRPISEEAIRLAKESKELFDFLNQSVPQQTV